MHNMNFPDAVSLAPERAPVKALPVPVLKVDKRGQDEEHDRTRHDPLFIHERESPRAETPAT